MIKKVYVIRFVLVTVAILALGVAGCKSVAEKAVEGVVEKTTGVDIDTGDNSVTYETEDGTTIEIGEQVDLPDDFPGDFPVYDADVESSSKIAGGEGTGFYVGLVTEDSYDDVFTWYKSEFADEGWEILAEMTAGESGAKSGVITVSKGTSEGSITLVEDGDVTQVTISVNVK
ncbi:MAG: hypothetical protein Q7J82_04015 [Coriobacteriia bacterium]|nr:hypothetical protein [Coriobacteriia bacterium]